MVFWEHKTELVCFLSIIEENEIIVNSIEYDVWEYEYEILGSLIDQVEQWDWPCF